MLICMLERLWILSACFHQDLAVNTLMIIGLYVISAEEINRSNQDFTISSFLSALVTRYDKKALEHKVVQVCGTSTKKTILA